MTPTSDIENSKPKNENEVENKVQKNATVSCVPNFFIFFSLLCTLRA